jgi:transposase
VLNRNRWSSRWLSRRLFGLLVNALVPDDEPVVIGLDDTIERQCGARILVEDNGPIHVSKLSLAALAARAHWLTVEWLPEYAPELHDIEVVWHDLKAHHLAHQTFTDAAALDQAIHGAVQDLNRERMVIALAKPRISA